MSRKRTSRSDAARRHSTNPRATNPRAEPRPPRDFDPVATRTRHDGWTPERQIAFIDALAASACVDEAARSVGMSRESAYRLRARVDAQGFRIAWEAALDYAIRRLSDAVFSRALNGVAVPHFYKGELIGEHRRYDERLAMFLLRYRDPLRYSATRDLMVYEGHHESAAIAFARARDRAADEAHGVADTDGEPAPAFPFTTRSIAEQQVRDEKALHLAVVRRDQEARAGTEEALARIAKRLHECQARPEEPSAGETGRGVTGRDLCDFPPHPPPDVATRTPITGARIRTFPP